MALALEECSTTELLGQNDAIKVLKKENELLKTEKAKLPEDVAELASLRLEVGGLRIEKKAAQEVAELKKQADSSKGVQALVVERALNALRTSVGSYMLRSNRAWPCSSRSTCCLHISRLRRS
jgi:hypothetical protein